MPFVDRVLPLEPRGYFETEDPDPDKMTYGQLSAYISQLKARGFNAVPPTVKLQRKVAFPFVTIVMTLLAVPFAVTTGRRGAMYGIGIGIALSIAYWVILQVFSAIGEGGVLTPDAGCMGAKSHLRRRRALPGVDRAYVIASGLGTRGSMFSRRRARTSA